GGGRGGRWQHKQGRRRYEHGRKGDRAGGGAASDESAQSLPQHLLRILHFRSSFSVCRLAPGLPVGSPRLTTGVLLDARGGKIAESSGAPRRSANDRRLRLVGR